MTRLPFDPDHVPTPPSAKRSAARRKSAGGAGSDPPLTVAQVSQLVKDVLADGLPAKLRVVESTDN